MKSILSAVCTSLAAVLLAGLCQPAFAQSDETLIERLKTAIKQQEPTWTIPRTVSQDRSRKTTVRETFEGEGYEIRVALSAYASASEAAEVLKRPAFPTSVPPSPLRTARRDYQNHNVVVNIIVDVSRNAQTVQTLTVPADVNARDASGKMALEYARERADSVEEWPKVLQLLADAGATKR